MALRPRPASTSMGRALEAGLEFGMCVLIGAALGPKNWESKEAENLIRHLVDQKR